MKTIILDLDGTLVDLASKNKRSFVTPNQLEILARSYRIGLITGSTKQETFYILKKLELLSYFDSHLIVVFEDTKSLKETGKPFFEMKRRLGDVPVVFIGDSINDEIGSRKAGIQFIRVQKANIFSDQRKNLRDAIHEAINLL